MIVKTINHKDSRGLTNYKIYDKDEADELGLEYVPWYQAEVGQLAVTDDNIVLPLISKKVYKGHGKEINSYFTFPIGSVFRSNKYPAKKFVIKDIRGTYLTGKRTRQQKKCNSPKGRQMAMLYAMVPEPDFVIDSVLGPHSEGQHIRWKRNFKTQEFKKMIREELAALLDEKGYSQGETLDLLTETIELCKAKRDTSTLMRAVTELLDMHGMKSKDKVKTTDTIEATRTELIDSINNKVDILKLTREVEGEQQVVEDSRVSK